jgi:hypothetical protein
MSSPVAKSICNQGERQRCNDVNRSEGNKFRINDNAICHPMQKRIVYLCRNGNRGVQSAQMPHGLAKTLVNLPLLIEITSLPILGTPG